MFLANDTNNSCSVEQKFNHHDPRQKYSWSLGMEVTHKLGKSFEKL